MAKQTINVGTTANDKKGDSLRAAFQKVNANFTELYTQLGLVNDPTLNLGAFEFTGSTMSTTDSTAITIDQAVTVSSDLTVGGDILPSVANGGNLGSLNKPFKSLYVSDQTVFFGGVPLSLEPGTNELRVNNVPVSQTIVYADIPNVPTDVSDLTDTQGLLGGGGGVGPPGPQGEPGINGTNGENGVSFIWRGTWDAEYNSYAPNDVVEYQGSSYIATVGNFNTPPSNAAYWQLMAEKGEQGEPGEGGGNGTQLVSAEDNNTFSITNAGDVVLSGETGGRNRGLVWDYGAEAGGVDSMVRQDENGLTVRAYTEVGMGLYTAPVNIVTNQNANERVWQFNGDGDLTLPAGGDILNSSGQSVLGGAASLTVTVSGNTYKGFGARYGRIYGNGSIEELTVSKIVIYKEEAVTDSIISDNSDIDEFTVTGLADSDVVAMFVLFGDTNGEKSLDTLRTFARAAIDTVILANGVEGSVNTIADMRSAFYANIETLATAAGGLVENFEFYNYNNYYQVIFNTTGQGTGSGFNVTQLSYNFDTGLPEVSGWGNGGGYTQGDVIVIPGTSINYEGVPLLSPDNDVTITITGVNISGFINSFTVSGTLPPPPPQWPENQISDGGQDQYDTGNYINTDLAQEISYAGGAVVADASESFGTGSSYVALYDNSIFGLIATGSSAASIGTSGGSGADGSSSTDTGELLATDRVYDPALTNLTLTNNPLQATPVNFVKRDGDFGDTDIIEDDSTLQIGITRGEQQGIYNPFTEEGWDSDVSPQGTLWSVGYQGDLRDITRRNYTNFYRAYGSGNLGNVVPGSKAVMYVPSIEKYYLIEWASWTQGGNYGGFSYTRTEIDVTQVEEGIQFADGTSIKSAEGLGRVKSTAVGNRRIEEVTGYKEVSVTERNTVVLTTTASRSVVNDNRFWVDITLTTIDDVIENDNQYQVDYDSPIEFSLDNVNWYTYNGGYTSTGDERGYNINNGPVTYNQGDTVYFRYTGGGFSQTWWSKNELPGGGTNFRGAVIDYHAYTGEGTIIGTIHIVDDDGDENITHTEVSSGSTDVENDDLWVVTTEGSIRYRRIDGESKTLKIHWTAKVFYGSELYD